MTFEYGQESYALRGQPRAIVLDDDGIHHPSSARGMGRAFTPYDDLIHVGTKGRFLWIGARRSVYALARWSFDQPEDPERFVQAVQRRLSAHPDAEARLARMAELDARGRAPILRTATWGLIAACLLVYLLQYLTDSQLSDVGYFSPVLFLDGDLWRVVTANLIHGFPLHLVFNLFGLFVLGSLVERSLGSARTICIMGVSAVGAMVGSGLLGDTPVVGVSGVVFGLAGGLLWLELRCAEQLPAWWRFPRRAFILVLVALALDALLGFAVTFIAGDAHLAGFVAGGAATALLTRGPGLEAAASRRVRFAGAAVIATTLLSVGSAGLMLLGEGDFVTRHAERLAQLPRVAPFELNNRAWFIAIGPQPSRQRLEAALALAERAVNETQRREPTILDTLAEVQFLLGRGERAIATIEEAIEFAPHDPYYREQRRRFLGERPSDDRPRQTFPPPTDPESIHAREPGLTV